MDTARAEALAGSYTPQPRHRPMLPQPAIACPRPANPALRAGGLVIFTLTLAYPALFMRPAAVPVMSCPAGLDRMPSQTGPAPTAPAALPPSEPAAYPEAAPRTACAPEELVSLTLTQNDSGSLPGWARSAQAQEWLWPKRLNGFGQSSWQWKLFSARRAIEAPKSQLVGLRLAAWDPAKPEGSQILYFVETNDGKVKRVSEAELVEMEAQRETIGQWLNKMAPKWRDHREEILKSLRSMAGVVSAKDVSANDKGPGRIEIVYSDGRKEVRTMDPLVFDLAGKGVQTDGRKTLFDLYGTGRTDEIQGLDDLGAGTGILVFDPVGGGASGKDGRGMFGDATDLDGNGKPSGYADGFDALRALVEKAAKAGVLKEEVLTGRVLDAEALAALERAYGLKMKVGGFNRQPISLAQAGVAAIALSEAPKRQINDFDGRANSLIVQPGAVFLRSDGSTGYYMNVLLTAKRGGFGLAANARARPGRL